jgi:uncharacterized protein
MEAVYFSGDAIIEIPTSRAMLLSIKEMEVRKLPFAKTWKPGEFDFGDSGAIQKGPLVAEGTAELLPELGEQVRVKGRVVVELETECDRCLAHTAFHIDTPFDLFYKPSDAVGEEEEIALDEGEAEIGFYDLPGLELEDILREQVLLQLPMQRVCNEACRGICPICGVNRNETGCHCEAHPGDDRWMALKDIHI